MVITQWMSEITLIAGAAFGALPHTLAQAPAELTKTEGNGMTWAVAFGLVLIVSIMAFINPKRSHHV